MRTHNESVKKVVPNNKDSDLLITNNASISLQCGISKRLNNNAFVSKLKKQGMT